MKKALKRAQMKQYKNLHSYCFITRFFQNLFLPQAHPPPPLAIGSAGFRAAAVVIVGPRIA
jgi:hypothetical protein